VLLLEALLLSSDSIARERRSGTWTTLVLTPLSAWQIVTGKWRAGQSYLYRHYGRMMLLRTLAFIWVGLSGFNRGAEVQDAAGLVLAVATVAGFMALNLALASATSLLASFQSWPVSAFGVAVGLQFVVALAVAAVNFVAFWPLFDQTGHGLEGAVTMALMPIESGIIFSGQFLSGTEPRVTLTLMIFALANAALLAALTFGLLRVSRRLAVRQGAAV
jgi:ABC-type transport system involved in multi-copper enzyme maturation permease subunit